MRIPHQRPAKAQIRRVRCWPLDSVREPWEWYIPDPDGSYWTGAARTHDQAVYEVCYVLTKWQRP